MVEKRQALTQGALGAVGLAGMMLAAPPSLGAEAEAESAAPTAPPSIGAFTDQDAIGTIQISPTGEYLAFIMRQEGNEERATFRLLTRPDHKIKINRNFEARREISSLDWIGDHYMAVTLDARRMAGRYFRMLMVVAAKSGRASFLDCCEIIDKLPDDPRHILMRSISAPEDRFGEVRRLRTDGRGGAVVLARGAAPGSRFVTAPDGSVVFSVGTSANDQTEVYHRDGRGPWQLVAGHGYGEPGWEPLQALGTEGKFYTRDTREAPTAALGIYHADQDAHEEAVFRHPVADVGPLLLDAQGRAWGVRVDHHFPEVVYLLPNHPLAKKHAMLRQAFPGESVEFTSSTDDYGLSVAEISSDRKPGDFVLVDVAAKRIEPITSRRPALPPEQLGAMRPVELKVRDGTTVYGYVTSHPNTPKPGPMVVFLHGGPHGVRDSWGFNWEAQLLASRGYHVLQVNYRGSGGYGNDYLAAGFGEWGGRMQDDVTDATRWAIANGIAERKRVCIFGASYGAYSALMGAAREPDLYRCAIGLAGIYDLTAMDSYGDIRARRSGLHYLAKVLGSPEKRRARSPVHQAGNIQAAVMLWHGSLDRRAPLEHAQRMRDALQDAGKTVEWHVAQDQGHGVFGKAERRQTYAAILAFLAKHMGTST